MRDQSWPAFARFRSWALSVAAHSRGMMGRAGGFQFERGPGAMWRGRVEVAPMNSADAIEFRAFLHSLRGRSGSFGLPVPGNDAAPASNIVGEYDTCNLVRDGGKARFSDCTEFSDGTSFSDTWLPSTGATAAGDTINLVSSPVFAVGDLLTIGEQLVRVTAVNATSIGVRPRMRDDVAPGTAVTRGNIAPQFRLSSDAPIVPLVPGRSREIELAVEEFY